MARARRGVEVQAYAASRGEEEPRAVFVDGTWDPVAEIVDRWREPQGRFFLVTTEGGHELLLLCQESKLSWRIIDE